MISKEEFLKQEFFEMQRLREKIEAICARHKCEHLADPFEAICRNTSVMVVSFAGDKNTKDFYQMAITSLALNLQLIEACTSRKVAMAFSECFNEASAAIDAAFKRSEND
jgi:hypothetical protein